MTKIFSLVFNIEKSLNCSGCVLNSIKIKDHTCITEQIDKEIFKDTLLYLIQNTVLNQEQFNEFLSSWFKLKDSEFIC